MELVLKVLIVFGIMQSLFLGLMLLSAKSKNQSLLFLALLLIVEAIGLGEQFLYQSRALFDVPSLLGISYPLLVWRPILIFFFTYSYFRRIRIPFNRKFLLHLILPLIYLILFLPLITSSAEEKLAYLNLMDGDVWSSTSGGILFFAINNLIHIGYYWFTFKILNSSKESVELSMSKHAKYIAHFIRFFLVFYLLKFGLFLLLGLKLIPLDLMGSVVMLISSFTVQVIAWFLLKNSNLPVFNPVDPIHSYELDKLKNALEVNQAYLIDDLSIRKLADMCALRADRVSELLRVEYKNSFKDIVNCYRVEEAKKLIKEDLRDHRVNLLAIAMDSGFNNKVTFYRAFKKNAGMAPSAYVRALKNPVTN